MNTVHIIGGGLAGSEAAWQLADRGVSVRLIEMRPHVKTGAHRSDRLAEIVCTNSLKSTLLENASGLLKAELDILGCRLLPVAEACRVPAGHALAVDRDLFAGAVTNALEQHAAVAIERRCQEDLDVPRPTIVATGPLTARAMADSLLKRVSRGRPEARDGESAPAGNEAGNGEGAQGHLFFYDAIAPSIDGATIDERAGFWASRYGKGEADYFNIPLSKEQYVALVDRLRRADRVVPHEFEEQKYFESCLPIEVMADRGEDTMRFGPLKPRGLKDPRTGREPYAAVQLRQESRRGTLLGLVGFQTRMTYAAQKEVLTALPGLRSARILRYGSIHRNIFLNIPALCVPYQRDRERPGLYFAGQICGVEGYVECIMSGLVAALGVYAELQDRALPPLPPESMTGSLMNYIHTPSSNFQPMNANMGIVPVPGRRRGPRRERYRQIAERALAAMRQLTASEPWLFDSPGRRSAVS